jgi:hypothetical protein
VKVVVVLEKEDAQLVLSRLRQTIHNQEVALVRLDSHFKVTQEIKQRHDAFARVAAAFDNAVESPDAAQRDMEGASCFEVWCATEGVRVEVPQPSLLEIPISSK